MMENTYAGFEGITGEYWGDNWRGITGIIRDG